MSFRELRCFVETMKALGYPRLISLANFRTPNFELVADCLQWLIHRLAPESSVADDISTEAARVRFLQAVASITLAKMRLRLNLRRLYAADGAAVKELLKVASLLHKATHTADSAEADTSEVLDCSVTLKLLDAAAATAAARQAARAGPQLHDGLRAEPQLRDARLRALAAAQDSSMVEAAIQEATAGLQQGVASITAQLSDTLANEAQLTTRLDRWTGELERVEKRLATLASVRPAYMDEYEALTSQLQVLWQHYLERFRNLQYLEAQLAGYYRAEQDAADAAERRRRKLQKRLAKEELRILRGEAGGSSAPSSGRRTASAGMRGAAGGAGGGGSGGGGDSDSSGSDSSDADGADGRPSAGATRGGAWQRGAAAGPPAAAGGGGGAWGGSRQQPQQQAGGAKVVGSLTAGWEDDDSLDDDGSDSAGGTLSHGGSVGGGGRGGVDRQLTASDGSVQDLLPASEDSGF